MDSTVGEKVRNVDFEVSFSDPNGTKHTYRGVSELASLIVGEDEADYYSSAYIPLEHKKHTMTLELKNYKATYIKSNSNGVRHTAEVLVEKLTEREIEVARDRAGVDKDTEFSVSENYDEKSMLINGYILTFKWQK